MIEPLTLLAGAGILGVGILSGRAMRRRPPKDPSPVCTCTHGYGQHEQAGKCAAQVKRANRWDREFGIANGYEWVACPCQSYDGPEPLPRVWTP